MTSPAPNWPRAERLDAERVAEAIAASTGVRLLMEGPCPGGQVGAAYVRRPDGRRSVLTWRPDTTLAGLRAGPLAVVETLRTAGYPAPAVEMAVQVGAAVALVQERLPGQKIDYLTHRLLDRLLDLNDLQAGALSGRPDVPPVRLHLRHDGPGYCLHEPLRRHSPRAAALERWVIAVADAYPDGLPGQDAVHVDFHPGNVLALAGRVTGVVDWDGAGRGDRRLDLVTLRFGVRPKSTEPGVLERIDEILDALPDSVVRPAWAHLSLRMADWAIRHFAPDEIDRWLDLAESRLD
ncbi:phosphotransferase [Frankia sp. R82]|uniref:phosphotransferase n=1 Tax=Frankia sp. R82 TaxID=2950553 RepID=UPI00204314D5|nr:phosphotransferase [Frankia sp. R82]MCM3884106.1 aminoglycoside phosphotransferase family protein [Frankia sp. R82]